METELGKEKVRFTVTTYDFLAYFVPGFVFILCVYFIEDLLIQKINFEASNYFLLFKIHYIFNPIINLLKESNNWLYSLLMALLLIIISYVIGHIVASFSAFFLDRNLIGRYFKYPYKTLLKYTKTTDDTKKLKVGEKIISVIFLINLFILILLLCNKFFSDCLIYKSSILVLILGVFLSEYISMIIKIIKDLIKLLLNVGDPFDDYFKIKFEETFSKAFDYDYENADTNIYWYTRNFIIERSHELNEMLKNWFNLYSFSRNLSTAFYLAYLILSFELIFLERNIHFDLNFSQSIIVYIIIILIISIILLIRYAYLYYVYYNKYLYRSFVYLNCKKSE
jgi:hypothetical protein